MNRFYFKSIISQIKGTKKENLIIVAIIFLMSTLFSIGLINSYSSQIESSLLNQVPLAIEVYNGNNFCDLDNQKERTEIILEFLNNLEELSGEKEVSDFNFNIIARYGIGDVKKDNESEYLYYTNLIGINNESFFENERVIIIDGRELSQEDIVEAKNKIVVSDMLILNIDGEKRKAKVGDIIPIIIYKGSNMPYVEHYGNGGARSVPYTAVVDDYSIVARCEVVGVYKAVERYEFEELSEDYFDNANFVISSYSFIKQLIKENMNSGFDEFLSLNRICFSASDYNDFVSLSKKYQLMKYDAEAKIKDKYYTNSKYLLELKEKDNGYNKILYSISKIKLFYNVVFLIMFLLALGIFAFILFYSINKRKKEIAIIYSIGESKTRLIERYVINYELIGFFPIILGCGNGFLISQLLQKLIVSNSTQMQYQLLTYSNSGVSIGEVKNIALERIMTSDLVFSIIICMIVMIVIIMLLCIGIVASLFRKNIGDVIKQQEE